MRTWREVRNFASQKFLLTPDPWQPLITSSKVNVVECFCLYCLSEMIG